MESTTPRWLIGSSIIQPNFSEGLAMFNFNSISSFHCLECDQTFASFLFATLPHTLV